MIKCCGHRNAAIWLDFGGACSADDADGESEPNYWLGYASGPRTNTPPNKKEQEKPTWVDSSHPEKARTCQKTERNPANRKNSRPLSNADRDRIVLRAIWHTISDW